MRTLIGLTAACLFCIAGCSFHAESGNADFSGADCGEYPTPLLNPETPDLDECAYDPWIENAGPGDLNETSIRPAQTINMSLQQCIDMALRNSKIMRDLGGTVLRNPASMSTTFGPAMTYADPNFGEEAALSEFDTSFAASAFFDKNDRESNSLFVGDRGILTQDMHDYRLQISKRTAVGSQLTLRHVTNYDNNNSRSNRFGFSSFDTYLDAEARQPLLQGAGSYFNRIAGPNSRPGNINGVLIGRIRTDISLAEFQVGIRDMLSNVENAYWDLYFAYRDLEAKIAARDISLTTWGEVKSKAGEMSAVNELQARAQYHRFSADVIDALNGRLVDATRTNNGSSGGTFRNVGGLRRAERRLRLMIGVPINDGRLIRPNEQPTIAPVRFDWRTAQTSALATRAELRRQRWRLKQRELELIASKNFLRPRLDAVARYRFRGFGDRLIDDSGPVIGNDAFGDLLSGDKQEWQLGFEFEVPLGFRRANAGVRHSQLMLAREKALLREQERSVIYGLSNAIGELRRAYGVMKAQRNRHAATDEQVRGLFKLRNVAALDVRLEAQRRSLDAQIRYYQAQVDYALALKNVHFEKGTLLSYFNVWTAEGGWIPEAHRDAIERDNLRGGDHKPYRRDPVLSQR